MTSTKCHMMCHVIIRCSVNVSGDSLSSTTDAMEGFLDTIPGNSTEEPVFMQVCACVRVCVCVCMCDM